VDGYSIASIEWSDRVGATKVTISNEGKFATLTLIKRFCHNELRPTPRRLLVKCPKLCP